MRPTITAFEDSPDKGAGQARHMRVRWALEEAEQPYDVRLLTMEELKRPAHLRLQPFGSIPTYGEGGLAVFEQSAGRRLVQGLRLHPAWAPGREA